MTTSDRRDILDRAHEPPALGERYSVTIRSSHLRATEHAGDIDLIIAAGWSEELGSLLYRLQVEFDLARSELRGVGPLNHYERVQILSRVRSLADVKEQVFAFADNQATVRRFMAGSDVVRKLVGRAIDVFLDPLCGYCEGRGSNGGYGAPMIICTHCHGSGRRSTRAGQTDDERDFFAFLLAEMQRRMSDVEQQMRRRLRT